MGPAPSDPRWPEADPLDLTSYLRKGKNVIGPACFSTAKAMYVGDGQSRISISAQSRMA